MPRPPNPLKDKTGIYGIRNTVNGKIYVGQTVDILTRFQQHYKELRRGTHHCKHLQRSFTKHGENAFEKIVLELCDKSVLTEREQYWMDFYTPVNTFNTAKAAGSPLGIKRSDEVRKQQSIDRKGRKPSAETKAKMSASHQARKEIAREKAIEQWAQPGAREACSARYTGRKYSDEAKASMTAAKLKMWADPVMREHIITKRRETTAKRKAALITPLDAPLADK